MDRTSATYKRVQRALETLFLVLSGLYLADCTERASTFFLEWPALAVTGLRAAMVAVAAARLLTSKLLRRETLIAAGMALACGIVFYLNGYGFLAYLAVMTVGFIDIDYRKILKTYLVSVSAVFCVAVLAGMLGLITNYVTVRDGRGFRSAWGICYYTDFASLALFLLMTLWAAREKLSDWAMLCAGAGFAALSAIIPRSYTGTICGVLFMGVILYSVFERRVVDARPRLGWMKKGVNLCVTFAFPVLALCMFFLMFLYARGTGIGCRLNDVLSDRLKLAVDAWRLYGLKPFGSTFAQDGNGFSLIQSKYYNFVDSTYPLLLLRYGWVLFLAVCLLWTRTVRKVIRCGNRRLALVMGVIAIHAFAEHHFIESYFNILIAMPVAAFVPGAARRTPKEGRRAGGPERRGAGTAACVATALLFAAAACLAGPRILSWVKTVLEYRGLGHGAHTLKLMCVLFGCLCFVCAAVWAVYNLLKALFSRAPVRTCTPAIAALVLCTAIGAGGWLAADRTVDAAAQNEVQVVEADRDALETAISAATGRVYSNVLPAVYRRCVPGISYSALFGDDLARLRGNTFLMSSETERNAFMESGCLYVPISEKHALYTGDPAVAKALSVAGYHVTGYYSGVREVDLAETALLNALDYDASQGLRLNGAAQAPWGGPFYDLYGGPYTVTWDLRLPGGGPRDGRVCTLGVTMENGEEVLIEQEITGDMFDGNSELSVSIPFAISDSRGVGFPVRTERSEALDVTGIRFVRTPDFDEHNFYDSKLRVIRTEYYDLDGAPAAQAGGYCGFSQSYDSRGNLALRRFCDAEGNPMLRTDGFAEVRWQYDVNRQVVREEYYDTDGQPVLVPGGYASWEREYDESGRVTAQRYYGVSGEPAETRDGWFEARWEYDDAGNPIAERHFDAQGEPVADDAPDAAEDEAA